MGVFKWLRRERVTVTTRHNIDPDPTTPEQNTQSATQVGTIRTEEYKRDLAEFQARRSVGNKELQVTPVKKKCGRHSLPVSCTTCIVDQDNSFNYEKKSGIKYKKKTHKRVRSATSDRGQDGVPNIQFLFQNQVFMPGDLFGAPYTEPQRSKHQSRQRVFRSPELDDIVQRQIDFKDEDLVDSPKFYKNNSLPFDIKNLLDGSRSYEDVECEKAGANNKESSQSLAEDTKSDGCEDKLWEVMSELKNFDRWADEQLVQSPNTTRSEDSKSETSAYGLPIASASNLDITTEKNKYWNLGKWGVIPVQIKKLPGVTIDQVKKKRNTEINILRKCRHPNIILLMGLYPDVHSNVQLICERCVDTLYGILHIQGRMLSAQTSVHYALDIANALVFLRMQGYIHTELSSTSIMVSNHGAAKLADLGPCVKLPTERGTTKKSYDVYSPEPEYVNIEDTCKSNSIDCEPLLSTRSSEAYLAANAVSKPYKQYCESEHYRWQAPELFEQNEDGLVQPCCKSDVYSLCLVLWESCNAAIPWRSFAYDKLKEQYVLRRTGIQLPHDGTYPGCLLALLQAGLRLRRTDRIDITTLQDTLHTVKRNLDELEYIIIPAQITKKKSAFSAAAWDTTTSPTDSDCHTPRNIQHKAVIHNERDSSSSSENGLKSDDSLLYNSITNTRNGTYKVAENCYLNDKVETLPSLKYDHLQEKEYSSACSTPIAKLKARIKDIGTPGALHRSDSTEYCSILSPNRTVNFGLNHESNKEQIGVEKPTAKLSRSFTPKSYKPLHIKVPEFNLDSIKTLLKDQNDSERSSYNFDIKNYSLPSTPIARSNKLRKNAWLSGDLSVTERSVEKLKEAGRKTPNTEEFKIISSPETSINTTNSFTEKDQEDNISIRSQPNLMLDNMKESSSERVDTRLNSYKSMEPQQNTSLELEEPARERSNSWSIKSPLEKSAKYKVDDELLASLSVKPLVAIHERWIYEANKKTGRSMSLPEDNKSQTQAVKPASHCVDTLQKSLPQLNVKRTTKPYRARPVSPIIGKNAGHWEQFCQTRDTIAKNINFTSRDPDRFLTWKKDDKCSTTIEDENKNQLKIDQATETQSIEEFIRELIRKEFHHLLNEITDDANSTSTHKDDILNKGVTNIVESLKNEDPEQAMKKESVKSFSRVKINGNNKPLLQITFSRSGENSLQVLDNCVNVTICDSNNGRKLNDSMEDTLTAEDVHMNSLKRCQAFNAIQEARSTEDLYIDDDLSTQMQENFGGKVKLIPLHGSLHEILCEKEDECCLIKVKQENGCDTIYFRCDNSDTESRDAIDGCGTGQQDTVVFKRSISLVEERIQRVFPKEKRVQAPVTVRKAKPRNVEITTRTRPKSEIFLQTISRESRIMSNSSPSLLIKDDKNDEVEVNIENAMCYQDSSSEECLKCQAENDDFELLEKKIEEDIANGTLSSLTCGCLEKISEENLSVLNEEMTDRD